MEVTMMDYDSSLKVKHFSESFRTILPKPVPQNRAIPAHYNVLFWYFVLNVDNAAAQKS